MGRVADCGRVYQRIPADEFETAIRESFEAAYPPLAGSRSRASEMGTIIGAPSAGAGQEFRSRMCKALEASHLYSRTAQMRYCYIGTTSLRTRKSPAVCTRDSRAYSEAASNPEKTPHSRIDVNWLTVEYDREVDRFKICS